MNRPTAILTESKVLQILERLQKCIPHRLIAAEFGVSKQTIDRISGGKSWCNVPRPPAQLVSLPTEFCDIHDEITAIKNHFALSFQQPIYWGWFESWDGMHSVVSDGYIIIESADLVRYAQKIAATQIKGPPIWAEKVDELPTFELESMMTCPIGECYKVDTCGGDIVRLILGARAVFIRQKYVNLATKMKLEIRSVCDRTDLVYLTRNKPKSKSDPQPFVIACCSTLQEI